MQPTMRGRSRNGGRSGEDSPPSSTPSSLSSSSSSSSSTASPTCSPAPPQLRRIAVRSLAAVAGLAAVAVPVAMFVAHTSYGGLVGRTWTSDSIWSPERFFRVVLPRLLDSNLAGYEEDGWSTGVVYDSILKTHGASCVQALEQPGASDMEACPCLRISRRGIPGAQTLGNKSRTQANGKSSHHSPSLAQPFFYLKLHKVGSTTVTNGLMMRCVEDTLAERSVSLASSWQSILAHDNASKALSKLPRPGTSTYDAAEERTAHAKVLGRTPDVIDRCRRLPLRISHNSIRSYLGAGRCSASRGSIPVCVVRQRLGLPVPAASLFRSLVVLRRPIDRFVSSMYFWNCERGTFPKVRKLLRSIHPGKMTSRDISMVMTEGRIDVDEPIRILSRGAYVADISALAGAALHSPARTSPSLRQGPAASASANAKGLELALRNLRADFDIVGVMEDMDAFMVKVALASGWDPVSVAYKPARVRENAAVEHPHRKADKCSVRTRDLSPEAVGEITRVVADEQFLYALASKLNEEQKEAYVGFEKGLEALKAANEQLYHCAESRQQAAWLSENHGEHQHTER